MSITGSESHPLFCQLNELYETPGREMVWKESSRWLKFAEQVESSGRWSKPHVATISLHYLVELRKNLRDNGCVLLRLNAHCKESIVDKLIPHLVKENLIKESASTKLRETLMLHHTHQYQSIFKKQLDIGVKENSNLVNRLKSTVKKRKEKKQLKKESKSKENEHEETVSDDEAVTSKKRIERPSSSVPSSDNEHELGEDELDEAKNFLKSLDAGESNLMEQSQLRFSMFSIDMEDTTEMDDKSAIVINSNLTPTLNISNFILF
jgi:hypothetical protein